MSIGDAVFHSRVAVSCTWGCQSTFCAVKLKGRALQGDVQIWMGQKVRDQCSPRVNLVWGTAQEQNVSRLLLKIQESFSIETVQPKSVLSV